MKLSITDHRRDIFKKKYVYPVVSRRAKGLSLGINLNTNNACNWQCIYCEVPNLTRGKPEAIDLELLENELNFWLKEILEGDFLSKHTEPGTMLRDIAFSGNGEPSACQELGVVIDRVLNQLELNHLNEKIIIRLITNGTHLSENYVQTAWKKIHGKKEIWFKIDSGDLEKIKIINQINLTQNQIKKNLESAIQISPTLIQTCLIKMNGELPSDDEIQKYIDLIKPHEKKLQGIHLYSMARPSEQKIDLKIERLTEAEINLIADKMKSLNVPISTFN